ncbi:MAG: DUF5615 family PIN-like protein [Gammaproteobacteria bacterium]
MSVTAPTVLIDENIPHALAAALAREGVPVVSAVDACMGQSDDCLLDWASREHWVLVTGDLDFPRLIFAERRAPPLLLVVERRQPCDAERLASDVLRVLRLGQRLHGHVIVFDGDDERVRAFPA